MDDNERLTCRMSKTRGLFWPKGRWIRFADPPLQASHLVDPLLSLLSDFELAYDQPLVFRTVTIAKLFYIIRDSNISEIRKN